MTFSEPLSISVQPTEDGVALVLTADRSRPSKRIHGSQVEHVNLTKAEAAKLYERLGAILKARR